MLTDLAQKNWRFSWNAIHPIIYFSKSMQIHGARYFAYEKIIYAH